MSVKGCHIPQAAFYLLCYGRELLPRTNEDHNPTLTINSRKLCPLD